MTDQQAKPNHQYIYFLQCPECKANSQISRRKLKSIRTSVNIRCNSCALYFCVIASAYRKSGSKKYAHSPVEWMIDNTVSPPFQAA